MKASGDESAPVEKSTGAFLFSEEIGYIHCIYRPHMATTSPVPIFNDIERHLSLGPTHVAVFVGMPYISYAQYRSGLRKMKLVHVRHFELILLLTDAQVAMLKEKYCHE